MRAGTPRINLVGKKFGMLTVTAFSHRAENKQYFWKCKCDCGNDRVTYRGYLFESPNPSCGCEAERISRQTDSPVNEAAYPREYKVWAAIKTRCLNSNNPDYKLYGARGIKVCDKWLTFGGFFADMGERPLNTSIERIDVNGHYCKENCRWATPKEQGNNRRNNHRITIDGVTKTMAEWAAFAGFRKSTIMGRVKRGISGKDLIAPLSDKILNLGQYGHRNAA